MHDAFRDSLRRTLKMTWQNALVDVYRLAVALFVQCPIRRYRIPPKRLRPVFEVLTTTCQGFPSSIEAPLNLRWRSVFIVTHQQPARMHEAHVLGKAVARLPA